MDLALQRYHALLVDTPGLFYPKPGSADDYAERFPGLPPAVFPLLEAAGRLDGGAAAEAVLCAAAGVQNDAPPHQDQDN